MLQARKGSIKGSDQNLDFDTCKSRRIGQSEHFESQGSKGSEEKEQDRDMEAIKQQHHNPLRKQGKERT